MNKKSARRERFEKIAARRTQNILDMMDSLGNCANTSNYEYDEEDVRKMFKAINDKIAVVKATFTSKRSGKQTFEF